jgi:molecular chaperone GrpE
MSEDKTELSEASADAPAEASLEERLATAEALAEGLRDQLLRALADGENTRRRAQKEAADARAYAIDKFARDLLSVADNLGRAIAALTPEARASAGEGLSGLITGVEMTEKELASVLERHGVKRIGAPGDRFDPNLHQAVAQVPSDQPAGALAQVFQPGYRIADRTLRAAMVTVSTGAPAAPPPGDPAPDAEPGSVTDLKA